MVDKNGDDVNEYRLEVTPVGVAVVRKDAAPATPSDTRSDAVADVTSPTVRRGAASAALGAAPTEGVTGKETRRADPGEEAPS